MKALIKHSTVQQKIDWLLLNSQLWDGFPTIRWASELEHVEDSAHWKGVLSRLCDMMTTAGLYSPKTYKPDIFVSILSNIRKARKQRCKGARK